MLLPMPVYYEYRTAWKCTVSIARSKTSRLLNTLAWNAQSQGIIPEDPAWLHAILGERQSDVEGDVSFLQVISTRFERLNGYFACSQGSCASEHPRYQANQTTLYDSLMTFGDMITLLTLQTLAKRILRGVGRESRCRPLICD